MEFEGKTMSREWVNGWVHAEEGIYEPPEGNKDENIEYKRGFEIRSQQLATSVEAERAARLGSIEDRLKASKYGEAYREIGHGLPPITDKFGEFANIKSQR